jgi:hypothetical protein
MRSLQDSQIANHSELRIEKQRHGVKDGRTWEEAG